MARNYGGWYNDKAKDVIDAKLALESAGSGAKAFNHLAKIPLEIDDRKMRQQALDSASSSANAKLSVAEINAKAKVEAARLGLKGREATAFASEYAASVSRANNINTNATAKTIENSRSATARAEYKNKENVQKLKNKGKKTSPTEKITYGGDDAIESRVVTKMYKESPLDKMTLADLEKEAKKIQKTHGQR